MQGGIMCRPRWPSRMEFPFRRMAGWVGAAGAPTQTGCVWQLHVGLSTPELQGGNYAGYGARAT